MDGPKLSQQNIHQGIHGSSLADIPLFWLNLVCVCEETDVGGPELGAPTLSSLRKPEP